MVFSKPRERFLNLFDECRPYQPVESRIWVQRRARNQRENGKRKKEKNDVVTEKVLSHQPPHSPPE